MSSANVLTNEQTEASEVWVHEFFKAFDSFNLDYWLTKFYTPDTVIKLGNNPSMNGYNEIRAHFEKEQSLLTSMTHHLKHIDVLSDKIYMQSDAIFIVKKDPEQKEIKLNAVCLFWKKIDEDKPSSTEVFFDPSPLIERIKMFL